MQTRNASTSLAPRRAPPPSLSNLRRCIHDTAPMLDALDSSYFEDVPEHQLDMLRRVVESHPYHTLRAGAADLQYLACGEGQSSVLFLSGAMANPYMWFHAISAFEGSYRVLAPHFPHTGVGANKAVDQIVVLLDANEIAKAHVVGYSHGGGVAQYLAERHPERLSSLVLSHTGVLRRPDAIAKTSQRLRWLSHLPDITSVIRYFRSRSGRASPWWSFRNGLMRWMAGSLDKKQLIVLLEQNLAFYRQVEHLPVGKVSWRGPTFILSTRSDRDTFHYFQPLCRLYNGSKSHLFDLPGGHHTIFLYPEAHTAVLLEMLDGQ